MLLVKSHSGSRVYGCDDDSGTLLSCPCLHWRQTGEGGAGGG